jgi:DNA-binding protein
MTEKTTKTKKNSEHSIYIGKKPLMNYVLAVTAELNGGTAKEVAIKARGKMISKAVDTAEIVRNKFVTNTKIKNIKISTENLTNSEGRASNVSSIEIYLTTEKKSK